MCVCVCVATVSCWCGDAVGFVDMLVLCDNADDLCAGVCFGGSQRMCVGVDM